MSHLDQDESPDWNDDIDAFEIQLRSLRPTPPARSWNSLSESIETSLDQAPADFNIPPAPTTSAWTQIISHSLTAAIGLAVGVALMWMQSPSDPGLIGITSNSDRARAPGQLVTDQTPAQSQRIASDLETPDTALAANVTFPNRDRESKQTRRSHRLSQANWNSTTLRVFGSTDERLVSGRDWIMEPNRDQNFIQPEDSNADDTRLDHEPIDKPMLSPGSFRRRHGDLTYLSTSSNLIWYPFTVLDTGFA